MAGAWPGEPAISTGRCGYVPPQAASGYAKKSHVFVEADCSGTSLIDLVTIIIRGE
jgi:hypothetical protein